MPLLGFTKLKEKLLEGSKTQTIRKPRKHPIEVGDKLFVYWKLRTKDCCKLGEAVVTRKVQKYMSEMTEEDAVLDGFDTRQELVDALWNMHHYVGVFDIISFEWTSKEFSQVA